MSKNHKIWETQMSGVFGRDMAELAPSSKSPAEFAAMPERARLAEMKAAAAVPQACGPEIPLAPARGAFRVFSPMTVRLGSAGQSVVERGGYQGSGEATHRMAVELLDPISEANAVVKARHDDRDKGEPFRAPFPPARWRSPGAMPCWSSGTRLAACSAQAWKPGRVAALDHPQEHGQEEVTGMAAAYVDAA